MNLTRNYIYGIFLFPAILSLLGMLILFYIFSAHDSSDERRTDNQGYKKFIPCKGRVYLVHRNEFKVFEERIVSLGAPNNILSHASIPTIGVNPLAHRAESLPSGLGSVKGRFVYEIDDPHARLMLYKLGFLDTTLLPESQFRDLVQANPSLASHYVIIDVLPGYLKPRSSLVRDDDASGEVKSFALGSYVIQSHIRRYFDTHGWSGGLVCR